MTDREKTQEIFGFIDEPDMEAASNSYLMSVVTVIVGIPLPLALYAGIDDAGITVLYAYGRGDMDFDTDFLCKQPILEYVCGIYCGSYLIQYSRIYRYCLCCGKGTQRDTRRVVVFW